MRPGLIIAVGSCLVFLLLLGLGSLLIASPTAVDPTGTPAPALGASSTPLPTRPISTLGTTSATAMLGPVTVIYAVEHHPTGTPRPVAPVLQPPGDRFLFVEIWTDVSAEGWGGSMFIDFPGYGFDDNGLQTWGRYQDTVRSPSFWGFVGSGESRHANAGGGTSSGLDPITTLPYTSTVRLLDGVTPSPGSNGALVERTRAAPVVIRAVGQDGTLDAEIDGQPVILDAGQVWARKLAVDFVDQGQHGRYVVESDVTNHGWLDRAHLITHPWESPTPRPTDTPAPTWTPVPPWHSPTPYSGYATAVIPPTTNPYP